MEKLEKFNLYIGLNDKDLKYQTIPTEKAKDIVNNVCGDCSIQEITGYYTHDSGEKVKENTLKVELLFKQQKQVLNYCADLKRLLNQESIAVSQEITNSMLI